MQRRRLYQPRTTARAAVQAVVAANRLSQRSSSSGSHGMSRSPAVESTKSSHESDNASLASDGQAAGSGNAAGRAHSTSTGDHSDSSGSPRSGISRKQQKEAPAEPTVPLPSPNDSIHDYTVLPSATKKVFQSFVFVRLESGDASPMRRIVFGPTMEWKHRFMRVLCLTPGRERMEMYRAEKRKGDHPVVREMVSSWPLSSLDGVHPQYLNPSEQLQFERLDYETKKVVQEYVYGHIRLTLQFQHKDRPTSMELCFTSSANRDHWCDFFTAFISKREREELLHYRAPPPPVVRLNLMPADGVQKFTSHFLSGVRHDDTAGKKEEDPIFGFTEKGEEISRHERSTSPLKWNVLLATSVIERRKFTVECSRVGMFMIGDLGEFAVESVSVNTSNPDVLYIKPEDPSVAAVLRLYLNDDKMIEVRPLNDPKRFRQWLHQCYGLNDAAAARSFHHDPSGKWTQSRATSGDRTSDGMRDGESVVGGANTQSSESPRDGSDQNTSEGLPFFQSVRHEDSLRRVKTVAVMNRKLTSLARKAIEDPKSFSWGEMASRAFVEYNLIGSSPLPSARFAERVVAVLASKRRVYVVALPPSTEVILDLSMDEVTCITGYSAIYGDAGFTLHLFGMGMEVHVVPNQEEARRMWTVALRYCWSYAQFARDASREDVNRERMTHEIVAVGGNADCVTAMILSSESCLLCGERKQTTPQCRVTGLAHPEFSDFVAEATREWGSALSALPFREVVISTNVDELISETRCTLARAAELKPSLPPNPAVVLALGEGHGLDSDDDVGNDHPIEITH